MLKEHYWGIPLGPSLLTTGVPHTTARGPNLDLPKHTLVQDPAASQPMCPCVAHPTSRAPPLTCPVDDCTVTRLPTGCSNTKAGATDEVAAAALAAAAAAVACALEDRGGKGGSTVWRSTLHSRVCAFCNGDGEGQQADLIRWDSDELSRKRLLQAKSHKLQETRHSKQRQRLSDAWVGFTNGVAATVQFPTGANSHLKLEGAGGWQDEEVAICLETTTRRAGISDKCQET